MKQAVILVGGRGTRLGGLTGDRPKPFVDIGGAPFIDRVINHARCQGVERVLLLAGHNADWLEAHYRCSVAGVTVAIAREDEPMGTGGALLSAAGKLDDRFLLMNGDSILAGNWAAIYPLMDGGAAVAIATRMLNDTDRYGRISRSGDKVTGFAEKTGGGPGEVNAGIYAVSRDALMDRISGPCSLENDIMPSLVAERQVSAAPLNGYFIDIGLPDTLDEARQSLDDNLRAPAAIFDRDNTLVEDSGYTHKPEQLVWKTGAIEAVRQCNDAGYKVFVATNQAGIARGYYGEDQMRAFHGAMQADLWSAGAHIDGFYHCPHHPEGTVEGLGRVCDCRKPATGMLKAMFAEHNLDRSGSFMVGDMDKDVACGTAFGIRAARTDGGPLTVFLEQERLVA